MREQNKGRRQPEEENDNGLRKERAAVTKNFCLFQHTNTRTVLTTLRAVTSAQTTPHPLAHRRHPP